MVHYFQRNIGDYHRKAGGLTILEHGVYTLLLDACYDREHFPTVKEAIDWCWARSPEEIAAVTFVLSRFFDLVDGRYVQARTQKEINAYHARSLKNKEIAQNREEAKRTKRALVMHGACTNDHLTKNQEPRTNKDQKTCATAPSACGPVAEDLFAKFWGLYPNKKAKPTALKTWAKLKVTDELFAEITQGLARQCVSSAWTKEGGQFIPHPTTWLKGRRWEDEVLVPSHTGFSGRDYKSGLIEREDGTYAF